MKGDFEGTTNHRGDSLARPKTASKPEARRVLFKEFLKSLELLGREAGRPSRFGTISKSALAALFAKPLEPLADSSLRNAESIGNVSSAPSAQEEFKSAKAATLTPVTGLVCHVTSIPLLYLKNLIYLCRPL
jgi:hypothetical protein